MRLLVFQCGVEPFRCTGVGDGKLTCSGELRAAVLSSGRRSAAASKSWPSSRGWCHLPCRLPRRRHRPPPRRSLRLCRRPHRPRLARRPSRIFGRTTKAARLKQLVRSLRLQAQAASRHLMFPCCRVAIRDANGLRIPNVLSTTTNGVRLANNFVRSGQDLDFPGIGLGFGSQIVSGSPGHAGGSRGCEELGHSPWARRLRKQAPGSPLLSDRPGAVLGCRHGARGSLRGRRRVGLRRAEPHGIDNGTQHRRSMVVCLLSADVGDDPRLRWPRAILALRPHPRSA